MVTQAVIDILNKEFDGNINASYYTHIDKWRRWWEGHVSSFHTIKERQDSGGYKKRKLYSLRMAKKVCEDWASVLLNEKTEIVVNHAPSSVFLQGPDGNAGVFAEIDFWSKANALVEKAFYSGTGAFVLRLNNLSMLDDERVDVSPDASMRMEYLPAHCIVPLSQDSGRIIEAAFVTESTMRGKKYIYLEIHTLEAGGYVIENRYYEIGSGNLKRATLPAGIKEKFVTGSPFPFFAIVSPNALNPIKDNLGLGYSIYAQAIDVLEGVDLAYNNFCRDSKLGGKKVFYDRTMLQVVGTAADGSPIYLTPDDLMNQLFVQLGDGFGEDGKTSVHEFNPSLRVTENKDAVQAQLDYLSLKCGLGAKHYRFDASARSSVTATEYTGEKQELKQNAAKHGIVINKALQDIVRVMLWAGKNILGQPVNPDAAITVEFSDGYIVSDDEKKAADRQDILEGIMQRWEYRVKWYGEDEATAKMMTQPTVGTFGAGSFPPGEDE